MRIHSPNEEFNEFQDPVPAKPWDGLLPATTIKSDCIQKNVLLPNPTVSGSEDCLYLNVYRPIVSKVT